MCFVSFATTASQTPCASRMTRILIAHAE
uniref:Uncharacterized protein n=1 Tax=Arundo donax TaxID=35708 RepID=A0A0A9BLR9_ARUDO